MMKCRPVVALIGVILCSIAISATGPACASPIDDKYESLGGPGGFLGAPTGPESATPDGVGRYRHFANGSIYSTPRTGAHEIHGGIRERWAALGWERSPLGFPVTDERDLPDGTGRWSRFEFGSLSWTRSTGATHLVLGTEGRDVAPTPEFLILALLVGAGEQSSPIGAAVTRDQSGTGLRHHQVFQLEDNGVAGSMEMQSSGCIYVACPPERSPTWYDTFRANKSSEHARDLLPAGRGAQASIHDLGPVNLSTSGWRSLAEAFPVGRSAAPRWFTIPIPTVSGSDPDHPRPAFQPEGWSTFLRTTTQSELARLLPRATLPTQFSGAECNFTTLGYVATPLDTVFGLGCPKPPAWATVLPTGAANHPKSVTSAEALYLMMQHNPTRAREVLGATSGSAVVLGSTPTPDYCDHRVPWLETRLEGVVTNAWLSGDDLGLVHSSAPNDLPGVLGDPDPRLDLEAYWLGDAVPPYHGRKANLPYRNALANDWCVFVRPDPDYAYLLGGKYTQDLVVPGSGGQPSRAINVTVPGNFDEHHLGNMENEIEQWLLPEGYRPEPGDRISLVGRWVVDCGHGNFATELHPIGAYASAHLERADPGVPVAGGQVAVTSVVVTGAWAGGRLEFDIWPPARPSAGARLKTSAAVGRQLGLTVHETLLPAGDGTSPNHLHVSIESDTPYEPLKTMSFNDVAYTLQRRLATKYRLWWEGGLTQAELVPLPAGHRR